MGGGSSKGACESAEASGIQVGENRHTVSPKPDRTGDKSVGPFSRPHTPVLPPTHLVCQVASGCKVSFPLGLKKFKKIAKPS